MNFFRSKTKAFKKDLKEVPFSCPLYGKQVIFNNMNHSHICFARLLGVSVFDKICPCAQDFHFCGDSCGFIGVSKCCGDCEYNIRVDYRNNYDVDRVRLACDERLIGELFKGFYGDYRK